jgi:hypothetical protein
MYFPMLEGISNGEMLGIHTPSDPLQFSLPVQKQIASLDPELPVSDVLTMDQVIGESLVNARLSASLVLAFCRAVIASCVGGLVWSALVPDYAADDGTRNPYGAGRAA